MLSDASSSSSFSISETRRFKGVIMIKFSPVTTKTKRVAETMWCLRSKGVEVLLFNKLG